MRRTLAAIILALCTATAAAQPITIEASSLSGFQRLSGNTEFGPLSWRGGLALTSANEDFGALSGLALAPDCSGLLAVADTGHWFRAALSYEGTELAGVTKAEWAPLLSSKGRPLTRKLYADAEALAPLGKGRYLVGFESDARTGIYDIGKKGLAAPFELVKSPKAITEGPFNGELEAVGRITAGPWNGHWLALSEKNTDTEGNIRGWLWKQAKTVPFTVKRLEDYSITDAAVLPDGDVLILERSFGSSLLPGMAVRRIASAEIAMGGLVEPELLFSATAPLYLVDNMEGLALCERDGETRLTIVSDNNLNTTIQQTLLMHFAYKP